MAATALRPPHLPPSLLQQTQASYGPQAHARLVSWQSLIEQQGEALEWHRLLRINHFLNGIPYAADLDHWNKEDYWATPVQFLATNGGDCEDYAIAKFFSLYGARVAPEKLRFAYVNATSIDEPHMVLLYSANPGEHPLVLDNLTNDVVPARERTDLVPVYSFNFDGVWLNRSLDRGIIVPNSPGSSLWVELLGRINKEGVF
ncbi:transglutaminase-like cysteine peptidase [Microbulbifer pacificus]|uniref:Transglutaminase-like cysteine peptidase n=1 Tax=Microbulbifer pacificus TaxID=407164 RepID=A0AAU0MXA1_9GAMM|nr:transglutaminase-like cysteine peptidase [Microbulbifer pacificus]WOX04831.1 transglutaminase-like cysteine peptidase [Microbulbifer pacificus]